MIRSCILYLNDWMKHCNPLPLKIAKFKLTLIVYFLSLLFSSVQSLMHFLIFLLCKVHLRDIPCKFPEAGITFWDMLSQICNIQQLTPSIHPERSLLEYRSVYNPPSLFLHVLEVPQKGIASNESSALVAAKLSF